VGYTFSSVGITPGRKMSPAFHSNIFPEIPIAQSEISGRTAKTLGNLSSNIKKDGLVFWPGMGVKYIYNNQGMSPQKMRGDGVCLAYELYYLCTVLLNA
jgi:hypothetical protein